MKISEPLRRYLIENKQLISNEYWYQLLMDCYVDPSLNLWIKGELVTLFYELGIQEVFQSTKFLPLIHREQLHIPQYAELFLNNKDNWIWGNEDVVEITFDSTIKTVVANDVLFGVCRNLRKIVLPKNLQKLSYPTRKCPQNPVIEYPGTKLEFSKVEKVRFPKDVEIMCSDGPYIVGRTKEFD